MSTIGQAAFVAAQKALHDLELVDAGQVEFREAGSFIQWRAVGDPGWSDLVPLADITGPPGTSAAQVVDLGGDAAANTSLLQAALDAAGHIYVRTGGLIDDTLIISSDTHLELAPDATIKLAPSDTLRCMIRNQASVDYISAPSATPNEDAGRDDNIIISGGTWDYDYANQPVNNGTWLTFAINIHRVGRFTIRDIRVLNTTKYCINIADVDHVTGDTCEFDTPSDGFHLEGPIGTAHVRNLWGFTGDDLFAFTASDYGKLTGYSMSIGTFDHITVEGVYAELDDSVAVKITGTDMADQWHGTLIVRDVVGTTGQQAVYFQNDTDQGQCRIRNVLLENIRTTSITGGAQIFFRLHECDNLTIRNVEIGAGHTQGVFIDGQSIVRRMTVENIVTADGVSVLAAVEVASTAEVHDLIIDDAKVVLDTTVATASVLYAKSAVTRATLRNVRATGAGTANGAVVYQEANITRLVMDNITAYNIKRVFYQATTYAALEAHLERITADTIDVGVVCRGDATVFLGALRMTNLAGTFPWIQTAGTVHFYGGRGHEGRFLNRAGGTVYANTPELHLNANDVTVRAGDMLVNSNNTLACGLGLVVSNGTAWKNVYTGDEYTPPAP